MAMHVCNGAATACTFGMSPSTLVVLPVNRVLTSSQPAATIMDMVPMTNVVPFGMCFSPSNPAFVTATAAAMGTPTPVPCTPLPAGPWAPGSPTVVEGGIPVLNNTSLLTCSLGGVISITMPGQMTEMVP